MHIQMVEAPTLIARDEIWQPERVSAAIAAGTAVEIRGSASYGWCAFIVGADDGYDEPVSPSFHPDVGDRLSDCVDACERAYGVKLPHNRAVPPNERPLTVIDEIEM